MKKMNYCLVISIIFLFSTTFNSNAAPIQKGILLYTPYTSRSITPGKNLSYNVQIINNTSDIQNIRFYTRGVPGSWNPVFTSSSNTIQEIAVKPKSLSKSHEKNFTLSLNIPLKIKKGTYHFKLIAKSDAGQEDILPLTVKVTKQGIFKTDLLVDQANMEGYADSDFNYNITLNNRTASKQNYSLMATTPPGWDVRFRVGGNFVTSVTLKSNKSKNIQVKVNTPENVKAGKYKIKIRATSGNTSDHAALETVIKGKYNLVLTTPAGRLSTGVTAGETQDVKLFVKNTGTVPIRDIKLNSSSPTDWSVKFDHQKIDKLDPGEKSQLVATIKASEKAIAGDYQVKMNAETPDASSHATFRVTVKKSVMWGSLGVFFIVLVIGGISYLVRKYGRR